MIEHFVGGSGGECFTNAVTEIEIGAGASVEHYRIQQESTRAFHVGHVNVRVQRDGRYASHDVALGASLARLKLGTIVLVYDKVSFVSAKAWVENPKLKEAALANGSLQ